MADEKKTPEQLAREKRIADQKAFAEKLAAETKAKNELFAKLKESVGKTFTDGKQTGEVKAFFESKELRGTYAPAYLVNFGNPNASTFIHCDEFLDAYKPTP